MPFHALNQRLWLLELGTQSTQLSKVGTVYISWPQHVAKKKKQQQKKQSYKLQHPAPTLNPYCD